MCKLLYRTHVLDIGVEGALLGPVLTLIEVDGFFFDDGTFADCF